jgi:hypothetical protein
MRSTLKSQDRSTHLLKSRHDPADSPILRGKGANPSLRRETSISPGRARLPGPYLIVDKLLILIIFLQQRNKPYDIRIIGVELVSSPVKTKGQASILRDIWDNRRES